MAEVKTVTIEIDVKDQSIKNAKEQFDKMNKEIAEQEGLLGKLQKKEEALLELRKRSNDPAAIKRFNQELENTRSSINKLTATESSMSKLTKSIGAMGASMVSAFAIKAVIGNAITTIVDFEKSISSLAAITGATGKDLEKLKGIVLETSKETKKGATEVAKAFELVASAKPELLQNSEALGAVTKAAITLSKASGLDLVSAVNATTTGLAQFNLSAEKSTYVIDAMAAGAKYGASAIPETSQALEKFGAVADSANISLVDSVALVQTLADKQLKGAESGTQLKNVILKLKNEGLGFVDGQFNMNAALEEARAKFDAIKDPVERSKEQTKLFGLESSVAGEILLANIPKLKGFQESISEVGGAAEQAAIQTDNAATKAIELEAQYGNLILSIEEGSGVFSNLSKDVLNSATSFLTLLQAVNDSKTSMEAFKSIAYDQLVSAGLMTDAQAEFGINLEKSKFIVDELNERLKNNLITNDQYAKAIEKIGLGWKSTTEATEDAVISTEESTTATDENTTSTDKNNKSKEKQLTLLEAQKKLQADFKKDLEGSRGLQDEIVTDEQELADKALFDFISREEAKNAALEESLQTERDIKAENRLAEFDAFMSDEEARLEFQQKVAESKQQINQQLMFGALGLASALANAAGGSMSAQMAALVFEKTAAAASVIINTQVANAKALALFGTPLLAAPSIIANKTLGAIQLATILATAIPQAAAIQKPKFKDGVIDLQGKGTATSDSIPAMLSKGESVMTAKETQEYKPVLKAMREGTFDDYINRVIVQQLYTHKTKERVKVKEVKQAQINFPKGFKVTNAKDISRPLLDAMEESKFLNQNSSWR